MREYSRHPDGTMCPKCHNFTLIAGTGCISANCWASNVPIETKPKPHLTEMDRVLGITGPLTADGERDLNMYCRFVRNNRREHPLPHLRLHVTPDGWWVAGPKGRGWEWSRSDFAVTDYLAFVGL